MNEVYIYVNVCFENVQHTGTLQREFGLHKQLVYETVEINEMKSEDDSGGR